ncbi:hypothetical protein GEMRC1_001759 [Eukaryota sp. GEM-RC1]
MTLVEPIPLYPPVLGFHRAVRTAPPLSDSSDPETEKISAELCSILKRTDSCTNLPIINATDSPFFYERHSAPMHRPENPTEFAESFQQKHSICPILSFSPPLESEYQSVHPSLRM